MAGPVAGRGQHDEQLRGSGSGPNVEVSFWDAEPKSPSVIPGSLLLSAVLLRSLLVLSTVEFSLRKILTPRCTTVVHLGP